MNAFAVHRFTMRRLPALCLLLAWLGAAQPALAAGYWARSEVWIIDSLTQSAVAGQGGVATSFDSLADSLRATHAMGSAWTDTAGIHLQATSKSDVSGGPSLVYSRSFARGSFSDQFVLHSPSQAAGAIGLATIAFNISGSLGGTAHGGAGGFDDGLGSGGMSFWEASFQVYGQSDGVSWDGWQSLNVERDGRQTWDGTAQAGAQLFSVPVTFGETLHLSMFAGLEVASGAQAYYAGPGSAGADLNAFFMNTMAWGGILALTDAQGAAVTDFSALSASTGFDYARAYAAPVPEPAAGWLLLGGGLALAGIVRRRRVRL